MPRRVARVGAIGLWLATAKDDLTVRTGYGAPPTRSRPSLRSAAPDPAVVGDLSVDVAIVGGGLTGLWSAYYLAKLDPELRIAILEAQFVGFGASGRNGGWCSALFPQSLTALARRHGPDQAIALYRAMQATVDEVGRVTAAERIDCDFAKGGTVLLARSQAQLVRAQAQVAEARSYGFDEGDLALLTADEAVRHCQATRVVGGTYTPHCAALHPGKLVRGLARVVERLGVKIFEGSPAVRIAPGQVTTAHGTLKANVIIRATEGYTPGLRGHRRAILPVYSLMLATEPLPSPVWDEIGLARRQTFSDFRHLIIYGQRTADDRLAFGGRGAPYHFGSSIRAGFDTDEAVHTELDRSLRELFPSIGSATITHRWGGPLGVASDWTASVGLGPDGLAWAGGYVGDGVATTNLAGRTLAELILRRQGELIGLPWVGHRSRRWPMEPLRWLGINAGLRLMSSADTAEERSGRPSRRAAVFGRFLGH